MSLNVGKRHQFCLALAALAVVAVLCISGCEGLLEETSTEVGSISGRIVDDAGRGLANATACSDDGESASTNANGDFRIEDVRVGNRTVSASLANFFDAGEGQGQANVVTDTNSSVGTLTLVPLGPGHIWLKNLDRTLTENWYYWGGSPTRDQYTIGGESFLDDIRATADGNGDVGLMRYSIGRRYKRFQATAGVLDSNASNTDQVVFIVRGDNVELFRSDAVRLGQAVSIDLDVSTVLTLDVMCTVDIGTTDGNVNVGWGEAILTLE